MINRFIQLHYVIYHFLLVKKYIVSGMEKKGGFHMKILLVFTTFLLTAFISLPTASTAETNDTTRSTSLGTGLPTSDDKYERPELTPEPTKPPTTDYEFVEDEDDSSEEALLDEDYAFDEDYLEDEYSEDMLMDEEEMTTDEDSAPQNGDTSTSNSDEEPVVSTDTNTTPTNPDSETEIAQAEMTELPPTGVTNNYWGLIGTIGIIIAVLIFFLLRKKK